MKDSYPGGDILIDSTKVVYNNSDNPKADQALLARYLNLVRDDCAPLRLTDIVDQGAAHFGQIGHEIAAIIVQYIDDQRQLAGVE